MGFDNDPMSTDSVDRFHTPGHIGYIPNYNEQNGYGASDEHFTYVSGNDGDPIDFSAVSNFFNFKFIAKSLLFGLALLVLWFIWWI